MIKLQEKLQEFLKFSNESDDNFDIIEKMEKQDNMIEELKSIARSNKTLLGRTIKFPMADSYALYIITKVNAKSVILDWVNYCDAWVDERLGHQGSVPFQFVKEKCDWEDNMEKMIDIINKK